MVTNVIKGRWGFYPCEYEVYRKLKKLNAAYYKSERREAEYLRWCRKEPQNRVIRKKIRNEKKQVVGYEAPIPRPEPKRYPNLFADVLYNYHLSRMPVAKEEDVKPLTISMKELDSLIVRLEAFENS